MEAERHPEEGQEGQKVNRNSNGQFRKGHNPSTETRRKISEALKGEKHPFWGKCHSEATRRKISESLKGHSYSEETRRKTSNSLKGRKISDEHRRKISLAAKNRPPISEETRRKLSEASKGENHPLYGKFHSEEARRKISLAAKNRPSISEETRRKMSEAKKGRFIGKAHPNWLGGISSEPYNFNWKHTRKLILKRDGYKCQIPDCNNPGNIVHHIDYNKKNDEHPNLITLCPSCHSKTNYNRDQWILLFEGGIVQSAYQ